MPLILQKQILILCSIFILAGCEMDAAVWNPPAAPELLGPLSVNQALRSVDKIDTADCVGPEDVDRDSEGRIYGGCHDGRIVRYLQNGEQEVFADTGGRPLGLHFDLQGNLIVADAWKGLLSIDKAGQINVLTTEAEGIPFAFTDDLDISSDGIIYFSDASSKYHQPDYLLDLLEARPYGRLLAYDPQSGTTRVLLKDLYFANGIALSRNEDFVLVNETYRYQVTRYWLKGEKSGTHDIFIDNLPGMPDGISGNRNGQFWVAMATPRKPIVDFMHRYPVLKNILSSLPRSLWPGPTKYGLVVALDESGKVIHSLHDTDGRNVFMITSVQQDGDELLIGSLTESWIGRMPVPDDIHGK